MHTERSVILGCCATGAKFTPKNHKLTGDRIYDSICSGDLIPVSFDDIELELSKLLELGCRYWHIHARNPDTREQSCDNALYARYGRLARQKNPNLLTSFGGSRNGPEIGEALRRNGEWDRISQVALCRTRGGADFVTFQAAIELQIACDLERRGYVAFDHAAGEFRVLKDLSDYVPSESVRKTAIEVHSTAGGGNYGESSAAVQYRTFERCLIERSNLGQPFEVEWVQHARSRFLTWYLVHHIAARLAPIRRLNITLLFGFSPRLPLPLTYRDFAKVVGDARSIAAGHPDEEAIKVSVTVGVAVLPQHCVALTQPMDVGPLKGRVVTPLDRVIGYCMEPDSGVDVVRVGLEDTPYFQDAKNTIMPTTNVHLVEHARSAIERLGGRIAIDRGTLQGFADASPETRPGFAETVAA